MIKHIFVFLCGLFLTTAVTATSSQEEVKIPADATKLITLVENEASFSNLTKQLSKIEAALKDSKISVKETTAYIKALSLTQDYATAYRSKIESDLSTIQSQITALGELPTDGSSEPVDIAKKRKEFNRQADTYKTQIADADLIITKVDFLNNQILNLRNTTLINSLSTREESIIHPKTFYVALVGFITFMFDILKSPWTWYYSLTPTEQESIMMQASKAGITMCFAVFIAVFISIYIRKRFGYKVCLDTPTYAQKVSAALWLFVARGVLPAGVLGAFIFWVNGTPLIDGTPFGTFLKVAASYTLAIFLLQATSRSVFTPKRGEKWRLIDINDDSAKILYRTLFISIILICFVSFLQSMAIRTDMTLEMEYAVKIIANLVKAGCVVFVSTHFLYKNEQSKTDDKVSDTDENTSTSSKIGTLITLLMSASFVLSLFGYIRLSEFILNRFIASAIFCGVVFIIYRLIKVMIHQFLSIKYWTKTLHLSRKLMGKIEFWMGFLIAPIFIFIVCLFLLGIWGVSVDILLQSAKKILTGFYIGGMKISLVSIFMGIVSFLVSLFVFRLIKNSLQNGTLSHIEMDPGVRNSLVAGIGFLGIIISLLIALVVMGGSLKGLALIAGALSLGAGLGLQNVVNNFVSGIILLFERPIKIGDWVIINGQEGIVKRINIRSTTLETWVKADVIIPNADILSSSLMNMTHDSRFGRVDIAIGVGYDTDIELVKKILLEIPLENKKVLKTPQPFVLFTNFGESSLDFQLSCYTSDITSRGRIATDLRERIIMKFRELKIEIPFPQRDIHIIPAQETVSQTKKKNHTKG